MAVHDLLAGVTDWLLREAVSYDLGAPLPSAPPLLSRYTHGNCDWFTGICSVPDRVTWLAAGTDCTASCRRSRRAGANGRCAPMVNRSVCAVVSSQEGRTAFGATASSVHREGSDVVVRSCHRPWDETLLKAPRNWLRKASMGSSGAEGPGSSPSCQRQEAICLNTEESRATIEIGTSWLAPAPLTAVWGWWSPSRMSTRFGSFSSVTHEVRAVIVYWIDWP